MAEAELKGDSMFSDALVVFAGALLMGQFWEPSEGTIEFLFFIEVPNYTAFTISLVIAAMAVLSVILAAASIISRLRKRGLKLSSNLATLLDFLVWLSFIVSWGSSAPELPFDQWWTWLLVVVGLVFFFLIPIRMFFRIVRSRT